MESFRLRLEDEGFRWDVDVPERLPRIKADPVALQHCILNLLDNAVKYSRDRKEIRVIVRATSKTFFCLQWNLSPANVFYGTRVKRRMGDVKWQLANSWRRIGYIPLNALKLHNAPETRKSDSRFFLWLNLGSSWRIKL